MPRLRPRHDRSLGAAELEQGKQPTSLCHAGPRRKIPRAAVSSVDLPLVKEVRTPLRPVHDRDGVNCGKAVAVLQADSRDEPAIIRFACVYAAAVGKEIFRIAISVCFHMANGAKSQSF